MPGVLDSNLARGPPDDRKILVTDQLSSTLGETDSVGGVVGERRYTLYGEVREGDPTDGVGFHGARFLEEAGLYYLRNRWYEAEIGRFISRDPIGFTGGSNLYGYVAGAALSSRDSIGLIGNGTLGRPVDRSTPEGKLRGLRMDRAAAQATLAVPAIILMPKYLLAKGFEGAVELAAGYIAVSVYEDAFTDLARIHALSEGATEVEAQTNAAYAGLLFDSFILVVPLAGLARSFSKGKACSSPEFSLADGPPGGRGGRGTESFVRAMSEAEFNSVMNNGGLLKRPSGGSELFVTQDLEYVMSLISRKGGGSRYPRVVEFRVQRGTANVLEGFGATHPSAADLFPDRPHFSTGSRAVQLKLERNGVLSYGLGYSDDGLAAFNRFIVEILEITP